ncbi:hypothetical protein AFK68_11810, partial [Hydrocoleum sp. CS-953]|uniref:beta strand repeat-containing protein n=1 Tax=Hydrocoleum sp. CS-953 TaxID=1671698 RepID=UPI000BCD8B34
MSINSQQEGDLILNDLSIITSQQVRVEIPLLDIIEIGVGESGQSGNVSINSSGNINLNNITIESDTKGDERAGDVTITSLGTISLDDSQLKAITSDDGDAGDITIKTPQDIQLTNESQLQADTEGKGNAGNIEIQAQTLELNQSTSLTTETSGAGKPGTIIIQAKTIDIGENAQISATVTADSTNEEGGGNINIFANSLNISGSLGIFAETAGAADAGTLTLLPYRGVGEQLNAFDPDLNITFTENGFISARTTSTGQGGNINIFAPENIDIIGDGKISVETTGTGNAGEIKIEAQNLTLTEGIAISAETNSAGAAGTIEINSPTVTIGNDASISATALEGATNTAAGGNITINSSDLNISGRLGIFAETAGESPAGTLTLNPYRGVGEQGSRGVGEQLGEFDPNLNITFTENGFISARTKATGDGGNINIFAPENINITGEGRITVETTSTGNAGTINIDTQNLTIAENTTISASTSDSGEGGTININPTQTFELEGQIITETTGTGNGGNIFINTGEMTAPNSTISAKSTDTGNAGDIEITAQENITTGIITSEANNTTETPNGGNISITSEQGQINATQAIQSFSNRGNAGDVTLQAKTDITTDTINSHGQTQGGQITITSETGNIDTSAGTLANYSGGGNGGKVTIEAPSGNITTNNIYTFADADGGEISLKAGGNINLTDNTNIISASEPPEKERGSGGVGKG